MSKENGSYNKTEGSAHHSIFSQKGQTALTHILHLSDLHFGTESDAILWSTQLAIDLRQKLGCNQVDAMIISGDAANIAVESEYMAAKRFIEKICKSFNVDSLNLVIVPGNHDVNWELSEDGYTPIKRKKHKGKLLQGKYIEESESIIQIRDEELYKERFSPFSDFYEQVKGTPYPLDFSQQGILYHLKEHGLLILGLNSAWQVDHHFKSRAGICNIALTAALDEILQIPNHDRYLKLAVWHHPISSSTDLGFMELLAQSGFSVCFHGHLHKAANELFRFDHRAGGRKIELVGAGTFGAPTGEWSPGYPLQYNLLKITRKQMIVETRKREEINGAWKPDARWTQGPGRDPLPRYIIKLPGKRYSTAAVGDDEAQETSAHTVSQSIVVKDGAERIDTDSTPKSKNMIENFGIQPSPTPRPSNRTTSTPSSKSKASLSIAEDLTNIIRTEIATILNDPKLKSLVEQIGRIYKKDYGVNVETVADMASKLVSSDVYKTQLLLLKARQRATSALQSSGKTKDDLKRLRKRVLKVVGWQILLAVNRDYISKNDSRFNPTTFSGAIWLPVQKDSSIEVIHATTHGQCAEFELIEIRKEYEKSEKAVVGKTRMDDAIIPETGPLDDIKADEIIECLFEYLISSIKKPSKDEMIEEIQAELQACRAKNQARYIVVRSSERGNALNDRQVLEALFNDLGDDLRIIFHDTDMPDKNIFNVSEIRFNRNLVHFLDI